MSKFNFKRFVIHHDRCAMKVGTDGVLLGAWTPIHHNPVRILDIGTGTGILALMLAQRTGAVLIDALDIDKNAYRQAAENFEHSPWNKRLFCFHAGLNKFVTERNLYDLIVCNPPFFSETYTTKNRQRNLARFQEGLSFTELIEGVALLLSENGLFSAIIPFEAEENFLNIATTHHLYPHQITRVKGTPNSKIKRSLLALSRFRSASCSIDELVIETSRHNYTSGYINLTKDFYLKM